MKKSRLPTPLEIVMLGILSFLVWKFYGTKVLDTFYLAEYFNRVFGPIALVMYFVAVCAVAGAVIALLVAYDRWRAS